MQIYPILWRGISRMSPLRIGFDCFRFVVQDRFIRWVTGTHGIVAYSSRKQIPKAFACSYSNCKLPFWDQSWSRLIFLGQSWKLKHYITVCKISKAIIISGNDLILVSSPMRRGTPWWVCPFCGWGRGITLYHTCLRWEHSGMLLTLNP